MHGSDVLASMGFVHSPFHQSVEEHRVALVHQHPQPVVGPSMLTGAQTAHRRIAGSRITAASTFLSSNQALNADEDEKTTSTQLRQ
jgi:hypothetical protein